LVEAAQNLIWDLRGIWLINFKIRKPEINFSGHYPKKCVS
jgi:hypothetical protein